VHSFLPFFLVVLRIGVLGDRRSSWSVKYCCGVRGVHGGSTIGGKIGGRIRAVGSGTGISSFLGRSNVLGSTEVCDFGLCNARSIENITKMHVKAAGFMAFIIGWAMASNLATRRFYGFYYPGQNPCIYNISPGDHSRQKPRTAGGPCAENF